MKLLQIFADLTNCLVNTTIVMPSAGFYPPMILQSLSRTKNLVAVFAAYGRVLVMLLSSGLHLIHVVGLRQG
ncbi:hypothetical protein F5882DRAFT_406142 [Hyaloscypha sp. PMI_1271]|nr:hypothetical protein F5882DRAFT_406142 [Hyaloscypha sp. PMI_1271]